MQFFLVIFFILFFKFPATKSGGVGGGIRDGAGGGVIQKEGLITVQRNV